MVQCLVLQAGLKETAILNLLLITRYYWIARGYNNLRLDRGSLSRSLILSLE